MLASTTVLGWMPAIACAVFKPLRSPPGAISAATACVSEVTLAVLAALPLSSGTTATTLTGSPLSVPLARSSSGAFSDDTSMR